MILWTILEGLGLGALLVLMCLIGISKGAVEMVYLYRTEVQERCIANGLTTREKIKRGNLIFSIVYIVVFVAYMVVFVYVINGARGFLEVFWQVFVIAEMMNLVDRFFIDEFWVGYTKAWIIHGTEDLKPYISSKEKCQKWLIGTVGMAIVSAALSGIMLLLG